MVTESKESHVYTQLPCIYNVHVLSYMYIHSACSVEITVLEPYTANK